MKRHRKLFVFGLLLAAAGLARAERPYVESIPVQPNRPNAAKLIVKAQAHPEVAVSRSLAAQPVHPWMLEMQIGDLTTWIDPLHDLGGEQGLPEGHSILRAQRLYLELAGINAVDIQAIRRGNLDRRPPVQTNTARVIRLARPEPLPQPRAIIRIKPRSAPAMDGKPVIPSVPKATPHPDQQLVHAD